MEFGWAIAGAALAGAVLLASTGATGETIADAIQAITGGTRLLADGTVTADGETPADPDGLVAGAGLPVDPDSLAGSRNAYALARMISSEAGGQKQIAQQAVGAVALNYAADHGKSIWDVLLHSTHAGNGFFGKQAEGRYAATSRDPSSVHIDLALSLLAGTAPDPTDGARQWDSPRSYKVPSRADEVAADRIAAGNELVLLPGVPASTFRFWRPAGVA